MSLNNPLNTLLQFGVEQGRVFGVAAAVTDRDGVVYEGAFGERALGGGVAMTTDTVGWIASMTKAITGAAVMQLVEQGRLDLDAPASQWVAFLGEVQVLDGFDDGGVPILRAPKTPITLRHLLTHTAGFGYANWNENLKRYSDYVDLPQANNGDIKGLMTPLVFDPGARWLYSIGIDWAGKVLEAVTGDSLGAYFDKNIFQPLDMASTGFTISPDMRARLAKVHRRKDNALIVTDTELKQDPPSELGGGGLYSTVEDYLKFVRMILNEGQGDDNRILSAETVAAMSKNQMGDCRVCMLPTTNKNITLDAEFFPGMEKTWGLTFMINNETAPTGRSANSLAWAGLANSYYWIDPTKGVAGVYLTQILPFVDPQALSLYLDFETTVYDNLP